MTVKDLVAILSKFDKNMRVLVDGYEFGFDDLVERNIRQIRFTENSNVAYYAGPHREEDHGDRVGIVLGRGSEIADRVSGQGG